MSRKKEETEKEKKTKRLRELLKGPDLEKYVEAGQRRYASYAQGARLYSLNYYSFVKLAKQAGANIQIKKKVIVDLELVERYLENHQGEEADQDV